MVGYWGGSVLSEMPGSASTETPGSALTEMDGSQWTEILTLGQSLFLKITIVEFEGGPLGVDADTQVTKPKASEFSKVAHEC